MTAEKPVPLVGPALPAAGDTVTNSGNATAHNGAVANTGIIHGDVRAEYHEHHHHVPSKQAANDSRRALLLHFRPEDLRAAFNVRDPTDMYAQMLYTPLPATPVLWLTLTPQGQNPAEQYAVTWVRDDGSVSKPYEVSPGPGEDAHIRLDGVAATEDTSGPIRQTVAKLDRLTVECRDSAMKAHWQVTRRWPQRGPIGSYRLVFELAE